MIKWFIRIVLAIILLPVLATAVYTGWNWIQLQPEPQFVAYLRANASRIDLDAPEPFAIAAQDLEKRLVVLGEVHGMKIGQDLDLAMLKMLNAKRGVRFYLGEFDPAQAAQLNAYLNNGGETHLRRVFGYWVRENAQWGNRDFWNKIVKIRALNATLPAERQIKFIGMDRVQDMPLMAAYLDQLLAALPADAWPGQSALMTALKNDAARTENKLDSPLPLAAVEAHKTMPTVAPARSNTGVWKALHEAIINLSDRALLRGRESAITASFERLSRDPDYASENFYGFWGQFHVLDATVQGSKPFVRRLQEGDSPFKGNTLSLNIINLDSQMLLPARAFGSEEDYITIPYSLDHPFLVFVNGINDVAEAAVAPLTLFKMNAKGSPYPGTNKLGAVGGVLGMLQPFVVDAESVGPNGATQYLVLAKGSPALTPLKAADVTIEAR